MKHGYMPFINYFRTNEAAKDYAYHALDTFSPVLHRLRICRNNTSYHEDDFPYIVIVEVCLDDEDVEVFK